MPHPEPSTKVTGYEDASSKKCAQLFSLLKVHEVRVWPPWQLPGREQVSSMACRISELVLGCRDPEVPARLRCEVLDFVVLDREDDGSVEIGPREGFGGPQPTSRATHTCRSPYRARRSLDPDARVLGRRDRRVAHSSGCAGQAECGGRPPEWCVCVFGLVRGIGELAVARREDVSGPSAPFV